MSEPADSPYAYGTQPVEPEAAQLAPSAAGPAPIQARSAPAAPPSGIALPLPGMEASGDGMDTFSSGDTFTAYPETPPPMAVDPFAASPIPADPYASESPVSPVPTQGFDSILPTPDSLYDGQEQEPLFGSPVPPAEPVMDDPFAAPQFGSEPFPATDGGMPSSLGDGLFDGLPDSPVVDGTPGEYGDFQPGEPFPAEPVPVGDDPYAPAETFPAMPIPPSDTPYQSADAAPAPPMPVGDPYQEAEPSPAEVFDGLPPPPPGGDLRPPTPDVEETPEAAQAEPAPDVPESPVVSTVLDGETPPDAEPPAPSAPDGSHLFVEPEPGQYVIGEPLLNGVQAESSQPGPFPAGPAVSAPVQPSAVVPPPAAPSAVAPPPSEPIPVTPPVAETPAPQEGDPGFVPILPAPGTPMVDTRFISPATDVGADPSGRRPSPPSSQSIEEIYRPYSQQVVPPPPSPPPSATSTQPYDPKTTGDVFRDPSVPLPPVRPEGTVVPTRPGAQPPMLGEGFF